MKKMYIAGKVTGLPLEDVQKNFQQGEQVAKSMWYYPVVPVYHIPDDEPWDKAMRTALKLMLDCDAVLLLNNYSTSRGALIEVMVAESINMPVYQIGYPVASMENAFLS